METKTCSCVLSITFKVQYIEDKVPQLPFAGNATIEEVRYYYFDAKASPAPTLSVGMLMWSGGGKSGKNCSHFMRGHPVTSAAAGMKNQNWCKVLHVAHKLLLLGQ